MPLPRAACAALAVVVFAACGSSERQPSTPEATGPAETTAPTAVPRAGRSTAHNGKFSNETPPGFFVSPRDVYQQERELCSLFPLKKIAKDYGVDADTVEVAEAVAEGYQAPFQQAAFEGCLDGIDGAK